jgi:hypothetical protein
MMKIQGKMIVLTPIKFQMMVVLKFISLSVDVMGRLIAILVMPRTLASCPRL